MSDKKKTNIYDILIVGGGVAGMSAAVYAKRRGKNVVIVESYVLGGQVNTIPLVENFPSESSIDGISLAQKFSTQAQNLGVEVIFDQISATNLTGAVKTLVGQKGTYQCKSVIIASGLSSVPLGLDENKFLGRGVSFCAVCDANFFRGKPVCVASRGGSGILAAKQLAEVCSKVVVLDSADMRVFAAANKNAKIEVISNAKILEILGDEVVRGVRVKVGKTEKTLQSSALFVELGKRAQTKIFDGVKCDANGFIITDENMKTNLDGVFAAGDVRSKALKQIVTAASDGAIAGQNA